MGCERGVSAATRRGAGLRVPVAGEEVRPHLVTTGRAPLALAPTTQMGLHRAARTPGKCLRGARRSRCPV